MTIDFFRGLALISIYVDHIPDNFFSHLTIRNLGFSDSAELFVFLSGYTASLVFGRSMREDGLLFGAAQVLRRVWVLYIAHIFLFVIFMAEVSWTAEQFSNPMFAEEMKVASFLAEPHIAVMKALTLEFQPTFLDILPLYIILLLTFIPVFLLMRISLRLCFMVSFALWGVAQWVDLSLPLYPNGVWYFNPFAWQFLFVIGALLAWDVRARLAPLWWPALVALSAVIALGAAAVKAAWGLAELYDRVPAVFAALLWPLDRKTELSALRLINFLALAHCVAWMARGRQLPNWRVVNWVVLCGQHSLYVFCFSIFLDYLAHLVFVEIDSSLATQAAVNLGGIGLLVLAALVMHWFNGRMRAARAAGGGGG